MSNKQSHWFTWSPGSDTLMALITEIAMITLYWITTRRWFLSLLIGVVLAAFSLFRLRQMAIGINWVSHVLFNAIILWEPFFVFSWLQIRFDRAWLSCLKREAHWLLAEKW